MKVERCAAVLTPNPRRVLFRPFGPPPERGIKIVARVMSLEDSEVLRQLEGVFREFDGRHHDLEALFERRFEQVRQYLVTDAEVSRARRLLLGASFTQEYALESSALFNPSIVWHPDQSGLPSGSRRFVLSLRAVGEGHLSCITFRSGVIDSEGLINMDPAQPLVTVPEIIEDAPYSRQVFRRMLFERGLLDDFALRLLARLDESFTFRQLEANLEIITAEGRQRTESPTNTAELVRALARANYDIDYLRGTDISERVLFPHSPTEINGIEDARFVQFFEDDGTSYYVATYTAWDGRMMFPQLLTTDDFLRFRMRTLSGPQATNKGMALFPRRIGGRYAMLSRQDNENLFLMFSDSLYFWYERTLLIQPTYPWEFLQLGNCGSPLETEAGWLVLTHGVGPMRKYSIGAILLDLDDPTRVIGRLRDPLMTPNENEREGYVPNVVYSCGAIVHGDRLILPYAMADYASAFATVRLSELLDRLCSSQPSSRALGSRR